MARRTTLLSERRLVWIVLMALIGVGVVMAARIAALHAIDYPISLGLNRIARRWQVLDYALRMFDEYNLFAGVPLMALIWAAVVALRSDAERLILAAGSVGAAMAAVASRTLQLFLPHLPRPLFDPALPFTPPYGADLTAMRDWSSFPSDHAALLWGLAITVLLGDRRLGLLAILLATFSSLVRLYGGLHYATDVFGGALLAVAAVCATVAAAQRCEGAIVAFAKARPRLSMIFCFIFAFEAASLFDDVRMVAASTKAHLAAMRSEHAGRLPAHTVSLR